MKELIYVVIGAVSTGFAFLLFKFFGGRKGATVVAQDTEKAKVAMETADKLLGRRDLAVVEADKAQAAVEEKLAIEDPAKRISALADELKDL